MSVPANDIKEDGAVVELEGGVGGIAAEGDGVGAGEVEEGIVIGAGDAGGPLDALVEDSVDIKIPEGVRGAGGGRQKREQQEQ